MSDQKDRPNFYDDTIINVDDLAAIASNIKTKVFDREIVETVKPTSTQDMLYARPWRVSFGIVPSKIEIVFEINETLQIGRSVKPDSYFDGLDLSPFNGYEMGISRLHAEFSLQNEKIILMDKGSANGTLLNQQRLEPETAYIVKHGDDIRFGNMPVHIYFLTPIFQTE